MGIKGRFPRYRVECLNVSTLNKVYLVIETKYAWSLCRPPVLNQVYWFNDIIFIIITSFYYFDKLKQGGISRGMREWNSVRSGGDPFLQREQLHRHGKRRGQPGEWLQAHAC